MHTTNSFVLSSALLASVLALGCGGVTRPEDPSADAGVSVDEPDGSPTTTPPPTPDGSVDSPTLIIDLATAEFGDIQLGGSSDSIAFTLTNIGGVATTTLTASVSGDGFAIKLDTCAGQTLEPDATCEVAVFFEPSATGAHTGQLTVGDGEVSAVSALSGSGAAAVRTLTVSLLGSGAGVIASTDGRINCPGTCSASYEINSAVTLIAQPNASSSFASWSGACAGNSDCSLNVIADTEAIAQFNPNPKSVFISSATVRGDMGGLAAADAFCNNEAQTAGLSGNYKAWLSDDATSASSRFSHSAGRYQMVNGDVVADNWADLTDGNLDQRISRDQHGNIRGDAGNCYSRVWTGTNTDGTATGNNCNDWTSPIGGGTAGESDSAFAAWTNDVSGQGCGLRCPLYCFEQ